MNQCTSCGMPMRVAEEHSLGDETKPFCKYCGDERGALKSYDEVLNGMTAFLTRTQGLAESVARAAANEMLRKMPAWRES